MTSVELVGIGIWCDEFSGWDQLRARFAGEPAQEQEPLRPELIAARELRRAPLSVKMAVEVMNQACCMAGADPSMIATVFAGAYGDLQITDYMCRTLAESPRALSPTRFHNSVHNAATGYWAIATGSHSPASAISAYDNCVGMAILEAATQVVAEETPVLAVVQELAAPQAYQPFYDAEHPFSAALLMQPTGSGGAPLASLTFKLQPRSNAPSSLQQRATTYPDPNFAADIIPLLAAVNAGGQRQVELAISNHSSIQIIVDRQK
jgi:hypothetical protein